MTRKSVSRTPHEVAPISRAGDKTNWITHLIDKGLDSIVAAGPVAWISVVCIVALCAIVVVVYIMSGVPQRPH